tara:strand:+ start:378 stop:1799 length:1422 start_codon:yes stop_codon:yes gene_type:complete
MANRQLITGAGSAYDSRFLDGGRSLERGMNRQGSRNSLNVGVAKAMARRAEMAKNDALVKGYINSLNTEMDLLSLSDAEQASLKSYLFEQRKEYAKLANELAQVDAMSPLYLENMNKMESIKQSFTSLKAQTEKFKERKLQYLDDLENGRISKGNKMEDYDRASKVYGGGSLYIGTDGGINVITDGGKIMTDYSTLQDPFLKDFKTADEILEQNNKLYNAGVELDVSKEALLRNKLRSQLSQDGSLESIVEDGLINNERLNVDLESYETREAAINDVAEILLQGYRDSALAGKKEKDIKKGKITNDIDNDEITSDTYLGYERNSQKDKDDFQANWTETQSIAQKDNEFMEGILSGANAGQEIQTFQANSAGAAVLRPIKNGKFEVLSAPKEGTIRSQKWYSSFDSKKHRGNHKGNQRWELAPAIVMTKDGGFKPVTIWRANKTSDWQILKEEDYQKEFNGTAGLAGGASKFNK